MKMKVRRANSLRGRIDLPGDKSISHRAALLAAMVVGETRIENFSTAADCQTTLRCLKDLGVPVTQNRTDVLVKGVGKTGFRNPEKPLDCGNSGTTMRLLAGMLAGQTFDSTLTGDESLSKRPMERIIAPLRQIGAKIEAENARAPIRIHGGQSLHGTEHKLPMASAQVKSCLLLAGLYATGKTTIVERIPTRDHTERMLQWFGVKVEINESQDGQNISVKGDSVLTARDVVVPCDISSAAFFLVAAACLNGSDTVISNVGLNPTRTAFINVLKNFGADLQILDQKEICNEPVASIRIRGGLERTLGNRQNRLSGNVIANLIDEIPILAILGTQIDGGIEIRDAAELRHKESDRVAAIVENLKRMGADVTEFPDGFKVERSQLNGAVVDSFDDHRIAMAFAVAGLLADGETEITGAECVDISFPGFFNVLADVVR